MTTELFRKKTIPERTTHPVNLEGTQNWFSIFNSNQVAPLNQERTLIEDEIADAVQAYAVSSIGIPKQESLWKKIMGI